MKCELFVGHKEIRPSANGVCNDESDNFKYETDKKKQNISNQIYGHTTT